MNGSKKGLFIAFSVLSTIAIGELRSNGYLSFWQAILFGGVIGGLLPFIFGRNNDPLSRN
jgi:hypothetical protein